LWLGLPRVLELPSPWQEAKALQLWCVRALLACAPASLRLPAPLHSNPPRPLPQRYNLQRQRPLLKQRKQRLRPHLRPLQHPSGVLSCRKQDRGRAIRQLPVRRSPRGGLSLSAPVRRDRGVVPVAPVAPADARPWVDLVPAGRCIRRARFLVARADPVVLVVLVDGLDSASVPALDRAPASVADPAWVALAA
jgi:hypothetical protein